MGEAKGELETVKSSYCEKVIIKVLFSILLTQAKLHLSYE